MMNSREIETLAQALTERGADVTISPLLGGVQVLAKRDGQELSFVSHIHSYGGASGLWEVWNFSRDTDPVGWLSTDDVLDVVARGFKALTSGR